MYLTIKHMKGENAPLTFCVRRESDESAPVILTDPMRLDVESFDNFSLRDGLRWYLEEYPSLHSHVDEVKAEAVTKTLRRWGSESFNLLFNRQTYQWYRENHEHPEQLHVRIESASPEILSWPWEALCDTDNANNEQDRGGLFFGTWCSIERHISSQNSHWPLPERPEYLRMLLVIARPFGDDDVGFHAVSRALVDYVRDEHCPVEIDLLRPPTFDKLCTTLSDARKAGRPYHIVHFDGHGGYGHITQPSPNQPQGAEGCLAFETEPAPGEEAHAELVEASRLAQALHQYGVSTVVLNACRSAMVDDQAKNVYASVAAGLLRAGIPSVIAMSHALCVSGAKLFVPAFYRRLFQEGIPAHAMRDGRSAMFLNPADRIPYGFRDWLVPQLYQGVSEEGRLLPKPLNEERELRWENLHLYNPASRLELGKHGLIGRDRQILELERLMYRPQAGILLYGLAGSGKTALVRGFLRWLRDTGGLRTEDGSGSCPVVWFDFRDQFSASGLFHYLFSELTSEETAQGEEEIKNLLVEYLKQNKTFVIWDNFESLHERLPEDEQAQVKDFLNRLQDGRTKVIITSRTKEDWLGSSCARTAEYLPGLEGDELWDFCKALADKYAYTLDPNDKDLRRLIDRLDGNPLSIRAVLSQLREFTPAQLCLQLEKAFEWYPEKEGSGQLTAAFEVVRSASGPEFNGPEFKLVLDFLGLHEHVADADFMEELLLSLLRIEPNPSDHLVLVEQIQSCFALLEQAGLCAHIRQNIFRIHPALRSFLADDFSAQERVKRVFVAGMCDIESRCHGNEVQRRKFCRYHEANLSRALELAKQLNMDKETLYLLSALAISAGDRGDYRRAESLWLTTAKEAERQGNMEERSRSYSQLSILAGRRGDERAAKLWSRWITEMCEYDSRDTEALYRRGYTAFLNGDLVTAEDCFKNAQYEWELLGYKRKALAAVGMLGALEVQQGDLDAAERCFHKLLSGADKLNDLALKAEAHRFLAGLEEERKDLSGAMHHYLEAFGLYQHLHNRHGEAITCQAMGGLYNKAGQYRQAKEEFRAALDLFGQLDRNQVDLEIALCYEGMGVACELEGSITEAKLWYREAIEIYDRRDQHECVERMRMKLSSQ